MKAAARWTPAGKAAPFLAGIGLGALFGALTMGFLLNARDAKKAQFAANDAQLPVAIREVIVPRFPALDPDLLSDCLTAVLTTKPDYENPIGVTYYYVADREPLILRLAERSDERVIVRLSFPGSIHDAVMTRDASGKWTGSVVLFAYK